MTQITYDPATAGTSLSIGSQLQSLILGLRPAFDRFQPTPNQGTSMASPHVAGVAALLYSQGIRNPAAIEQAIKKCDANRRDG